MSSMTTRGQTTEINNRRKQPIWYVPGSFLRRIQTKNPHTFYVTSGNKGIDTIYKHIAGSLVTGKSIEDIVKFLRRESPG